ncbi:T9SS type A sorting domain-containing protein [Aurantibacillus circumpalustris]|uniref:T9SS type A sorting domain-containing protein n=1 Tax=Aurantibacillus circumpalustris TaxID=3036359 RepID=UPI00295A65B2|nr:T9SS type A sorting domain-containing protein [Aurantibacillus circumpalustris]
MKRIFSYLLAVAFSFNSQKAVAQVVIDLSTGIDNAGQPKVPGSYDNKWYVSPPILPQTIFIPWALSLPPIPSTFQNVFVTSGILEYNLCHASPITCPINSGSRFISPNINPSTGNAIGTISGDFLYKMTFNYTPCQASSDHCTTANQIIKSAIFNFRLVRSSVIWGLIINGHFHGDMGVFSAPYNYGVSSRYNTSFSIPTSEINQGLNTIYIWAMTADCTGNVDARSGTSGIEIEGNLTLFYYGLTDNNGNEKNEFCIEEDVFFEGSNVSGSNFIFDLYYDDGTVNNHLAQKISNKKPYWLNITEEFSSLIPANFFALNTTGTYKIKLTTEDPCDPTKTIQTTKEFKYKCCSNSADASFKLYLDVDSKLHMNSNARGTHDWKVYSTPNANTGPYTLTNEINDVSSFIMDVPPESEMCYYVTHKVINDCGESCVSQSSCKLSCETGDCILGVPYALNYNSYSNELTWSPVTGAIKYIVEVTENGCCGSPEEPLSTSQFHSFIVQNNEIPYVINLSNLGGNGDLHPIASCYLIKVYAVCADGTRSRPSTICVGGEAGNRMQQPVGLSLIDAEGPGVTLYPNPTQGKVSIDVSVMEDVEFGVTVFDRMGRMVKTFNNIKTNERRSSLNWSTENLNKGIYLVRIVTADNKITNKKLIVE